MRTKAITMRIINQLKHDKRTMALILFAPLLVLGLVYSIIGDAFFDHYGATVIGIIVFFFVFVVAGINFLTERVSGTLEKMFSTPVRCAEIILGYVIGFGILTLIQTVLITLFCVYILGINVAGSVWIVLLINFLTAVAALTLGMLLSTLANSEFQMLQFIPIIIVPQIFLCGLFPLSDGWTIVSKYIPLTYTAEGLQDVIIKGNGIATIGGDILALGIFSLVFIILNYVLLRKQRKW